MSVSLSFDTCGGEGDGDTNSNCNVEVSTEPDRHVAAEAVLAAEAADGAVEAVAAAAGEEDSDTVNEKIRDETEKFSEHEEEAEFYSDGVATENGASVREPERQADDNADVVAVALRENLDSLGDSGVLSVATTNNH